MTELQLCLVPQMSYVTSSLIVVGYSETPSQEPDFSAGVRTRSVHPRWMCSGLTLFHKNPEVALEMLPRKGVITFKIALRSS